MEKYRAVLQGLLVFTITILLMGGCAFIEKFFGAEEEMGASELLTEGIENFERGNFEAAKDAFQKLKDRYPYSKYAILAELRMADAMYEKGDYEDAYAAYDEFERLHPKNPEIPYVIFQRGMCKFRQMTTFDREQGQTLKAKEEFERLIRRFPRDEYAQVARKNIRKCLIYLAEYEFYVANFYFKMEKYEAALARYTYLIENYTDMGQYHNALEMIARCKEKIAKAEKEAAEKAAKKAEKEAKKTAEKEEEKKAETK